MKTTKIVSFLTTGVLLMSLLVVQAAAATVAGFEIDGNTASDGDDDWETVVASADGILIQDGNSGPKSTSEEMNIFAKGGKFGDPAGWTIEPGNSPAQNDLTNVEVYATKDSLSGDSWLFMGMERIKKQGTFDLDFEYNKIAWDGTSGTLQRSEGDLVIGFELSGNPTGPDDLEVLIAVYEPDNATCSGYAGVYGAGFCEVYRGPAGSLGLYGEATMNDTAFPAPPWGSVDSAGNPVSEIDPYFFAEAAINLTELGIDLSCPGFGSVHAKSRSSLEVTADLKDLAGPVAFSISCYIEGYKFHDLDADGVWDAGEPGLEGWTISLDSGASVDTDANGYFKFDGLSDGTYTVQEVCPADWFQSYPGPNPAAVCGDNTHTFDINILTPNASGNFGNYQNSTFSGYKFKDANNDGTYNGIDSYLDDWEITVVGTTGTGDSVDYSVMTGFGDWEDGYFEFSLPPGDYTFCEVGQDYWQQTAPDNSVCSDGSGGFVETLTSQEDNSDNLFGNTPLAEFDVNFYDLTGSTNATIKCYAGDPGDTSNQLGGDETVSFDSGEVVVGNYYCTIEIVDP